MLLRQPLPLASTRQVGDVRDHEAGHAPYPRLVSSRRQKPGCAPARSETPPSRWTGRHGLGRGHPYHGFRPFHESLPCGSSGVEASATANCPQGGDCTRSSCSVLSLPQATTTGVPGKLFLPGLGLHPP